MNTKSLAVVTPPPYIYHIPTARFEMPSSSTDHSKEGGREKPPLQKESIWEDAATQRYKCTPYNIPVKLSDPTDYYGAE